MGGGAQKVRNPKPSIHKFQRKERGMVAELPPSPRGVVNRLLPPGSPLVLLSSSPLSATVSLGGSRALNGEDCASDQL